MRDNSWAEKFYAGDNYSVYNNLGSHFEDGGVRFTLWAPNAKWVSVVGDFNEWNQSANSMSRNDVGIWETFIPNLRVYDAYKYAICGEDGEVHLKADPYAYHCETRPGTASKLYDINGYEWGDGNWIKYKKKHMPYNRPMNIYEVQLASWRLHEDGNPYTYRELAHELVEYVKEMGYTHIELLPITEFPYDGSWGYQVSGYFAPTSRFGTPHDLMYFVDMCHQNGIGVIVDWVPAHFPKDEHGLYRFDGSWLYEYTDPLKREHKGWGTHVFDYGRHEIRSFLISSATFWIDKYHFDGIRVDAVASMLYLDYDRDEWRPNCYGGHENLEAISFLRELNSAVLSKFPETLMIAEESTAWPMVTKPPYDGGLGFNFKWNMGWMNDTLSYFSTDPYFRSGCHNKLTFSLTYAFSENFVLPFSHDEVVHGKCSLIEKQPGEYLQKFAGLRAMIGYMMMHPGKKLNFMGSEFGQFIEWDYKKQLDWFLLEYDMHKKHHTFIKELNGFYLSNSQLWQIEDSWDGFRWLLPDENDRNILAFVRRNKKGETLVVICNFSPVKWEAATIPVLSSGNYVPVFTTEEERFGGAGHNLQVVSSSKMQYGEYSHGIVTDILPMSVTVYKRERKKSAKER
ncbi:MAG: 1,4-alpha-glucan branching protein GlgB [Clostridia bacterium]|nr:1,4-alpha-glucan branching protein GlgB [Clostridia bacterium]